MVVDEKRNYVVTTPSWRTRAVEILNERGWGQIHNWPNGSICAAMAAYLAGGERAVMELGAQIKGSTCLSHEGATTIVARWNDSPARTKSEVISKLLGGAPQCQPNAVKLIA